MKMLSFRVQSWILLTVAALTAPTAAFAKDEPILYLGGWPPVALPNPLPLHAPPQSCAGVLAIDAATERKRMLESWAALKKHYLKPGAVPEYLASVKNPKRAGAWGLSQVIHAAAFVGKLSGGNYRDLEQAIQALEPYGEDSQTTPPNFAYAPYPPGPNQSEPRFYDDNGHLALALLQAAAQVPDGPYLEMVYRLWPFFQSGQGVDGGEYWVESDEWKRRGMPASGSTTNVALRLFMLSRGEATGHGRHVKEHARPGPRSERTVPLPLRGKVYMDFALLNATWLQSHLYDAATGYYRGTWFDDVKALAKKCDPPGYNGTHLCPWVFSYDEGFMIGMNVLLYRATGDSHYLDQATKSALASLGLFTGDRLWSQAPAFNAIFFRNLIMLDHYAPNAAYRCALQTYLYRLWTRGRDASTGLFGLGGMGAFGNDFGSLDQAGIVELLALPLWPRELIPDMN